MKCGKFGNRRAHGLLLCLMAGMVFAPVLGTAQLEVSFGYDAAGRLTSAYYNENGTNSAVLIEYDPAGNRNLRVSVGKNDTTFDSDADGLADLNEAEFFGHLGETGAGDPDADGLSNSNELAFGSSPVLKNTDGDFFDDYGEWVADTDPADSNDWFRIAAVSNGPPFSIYFISSANRNYTLGYSTDLVGSVWGDLPGQGPRAGTGGPDSLTDTNSAPQRFYRIEVQLP